MTNLDETILALIKAELDARRIETEDKELIKAYIEGEMDGWELELPQPEEEQPKGPSVLFKYISALAQANDLPEPDPFVLGLAVIGEEKWLDKHRQAAWAVVNMQYSKWFESHGYDLLLVESPSQKPKNLEKKYTKSVTLDSRTGGFIIRFRGLTQNEHIRVMDAVRSIPGWKFHDGNKPLARLKEPHWVVPGEESAARRLNWYLYESQAYYSDKRDTDLHKAAYWDNLLEELPWDIEEGVKERINFLIERATLMVPMSEAHYPSDNFQLRHDYKSVDGKTPFPYQISGVEYILLCTRESRYSHGLSGNGVYVADPMGLGKTIEAGIMATVESWLEEMERNPEKKIEDLRALILCPAATKIGWSREITRWVEDLGFTVQIMRGLGPQPIKANFVIVNPQLLKKELNQETGIWEPMPLFTMLLATRWFAVVADEGQMYSHWTTQRTGNALELFSGKRWDSKTRKFVQWRLPAPLRLILSGSPIMNRPVEYASQLEALGLLEAFGGQARFENEWGRLDKTNKSRRVAKMKELHYKLRQLGYLRREKETMVLTDEQKTIPLDTVPSDVLNRTFIPEEQWAEVLENQGWQLLSGVLGQLPPKIRTVVHLPITNRLTYKKAEKDLFRWIIDEFGDDPDLEDKLNRARRGYALKLIATLKKLAEEGKVKAAKKWLEDFLNETDDQKIVFYTSHLHVQDAFIEHFPGAALIRGGQSEDERQRNIDRFQTDPNCRVILCMLQAGGTGITLTAAHHLAFLSLGWNPSTHDQAEDRIWGRVNDLHGASVYYFLAENTIDIMMAGIIDHKREITMASIQGADADTSMMVELMSRYADKARKHEMAEMLGIDDDELDDA
jgi:SWI/SNF-related matrix-associated actin-dependent regulator 1 of chromatin subfamily A